MRPAAVLASLLLATSALAGPLNGAPVGSALQPVKRDSEVVALDLEKRQLGLDLSGVTGLVGILLSTVTGLLSNTLGSIKGLDSTILNLLNTGAGDLKGPLATVQATVLLLIAQVNSISDKIGVVPGLNGIADQLLPVIDEVGKLLADVKALAASKDPSAAVTQLENSLNDLLGALNALLAKLG